MKLLIYILLFSISVFINNTFADQGCVMSIKGITYDYPPDTSFTLIPTYTNVAYPAYLGSITGPVFSNKITRLSDYPAVWVDVEYPKTPSWNIDGTLLIMSHRLLDGNTYQLIANNTWWDDDEKKWSAKYPNIYYAMEHNYDVTGDGINDHVFVRRDVTLTRQTGAVPAKEILKTFSGDIYDNILIGKYEGNIDHNDKYVVFAGLKKNTNYLTAIVYDIQDQNIVTETNLFDIRWEDDLGGQILDWISVSPSGQHILINWKKYPNNPDADYRYVIDQYDLNMNFIRQLSDQGQHGDIGVNFDGKDVYVQFGFGAKSGIWAYDLDTGVETRLLPSKYNGGHVSCRNYLRRGWCYLTTKYEGYREVFALKLDGSGTVNRFAQTHADSIDAEGGVNSFGTKIIFSSNWGGATSNNTDEAFVVEVIQQ